MAQKTPNTDWTLGPGHGGTRGTPNPDYGRGIFRRRVVLISQEMSVRAGVEDAYHSFRLTLKHDRHAVVALDAQALRVPLSTCPAATIALSRLVGTPLDASLSSLRREHSPRSHCTHLYDLASLALAHALRQGRRQYDVEIPDEYPGAAWSRVLLNDVEVHRWQTYRNTIQAPDTLRGHPLLRGFNEWAQRAFTGDALEAARAFQQGYFVSRARPWGIEADAGQSVAHHAAMRGACFSYAPEVMATAIRLAGTTRDTTDAGTPLLADLMPT